MKICTRFVNKKRAISPVISVILLIGLAVAAVAAIFIFIIPLITPKPDLQLDSAIIEYDDDFTTAADEGEGYGKGLLVLSNMGAAESKITSLKVFYGNSILGPWTQITVHDKVIITTDNPLVIAPAKMQEDLTVRFPIPTENDDNAIYYRISISTEEGRELDTTTTETVIETQMKLEKDRPDISFTGTLGNIRRTKDIAPTAVSDNSQIKNVTYQVYNSTGSLVVTKTITAPLWRWSWATYGAIANGTYNMIMTVYDYAGLSTSTGTPISFTIDNDYVKPTIKNIVGSSIKNGPDLAEVGESFSVRATITDSGSAVSKVAEAYLYYKLNDSSTTYSSIAMSEFSDDIWQGNIPAAFIDSTALENNLTYYLIAEDDDDNLNTSANQEAGVIDTTKPDITGHTPITQVNWLTEDEPVITISVTVVDKDIVDLVTLVWRQGNDTGLTIADPWQVENYITQSGDTWEFKIPRDNVTMDGLDYYINATDPSGNTNDGSASSPYHITLIDGLSPVIRFDPELTSPTVPGQNLPVRVAVEDNDISFSTERFISETGTVQLSYSDDGVDFSTPVDLTHTSGDSSLGRLVEGIWQGSIDGINIVEETTLYVLVEATDESDQTIAIQREIAVSKANEPLFRVSGTTNTTGAYDHQIEVDIENYGLGDAIITNMTVYLYDNTKLSYLGSPLLTQIDATIVKGTEPGGINPRWANVSTPSEFTNGTEKNLINIIDIDKTEITKFTFTYANDSGVYFDVNDMTIGIKLGYTYASGSSNGYSGLIKANSTITTFQTYTETRYMRSDSQLGTTQSTGFQTLNERNPRWSGSQTVYWYIEVWQRKIDSSMYQISTGEAARVYRTSDGNGLQQGTWNLGSDFNLDTTDVIVVRVYMRIGSTVYGPVEFVTEQLDADKLVAGDWTVWYYTERDYESQWNQDRTRGIFYYGDTIYNSRILNFKYTSLPGGAPLLLKVSSLASPIPPITKIYQSSKQIDIQILSYWKRILRSVPLSTMDYLIK
ncbi:MAG: archaellin/type IV pilin N-terminal domain-containing protein [Promethearchaeota archaeon]